MVHQHLRLVESMTVAENVVLGSSAPRQLRFSPRAVERTVAEAAERFQMSVDPRARIWQLSLGERQRVEILKALCRGARILILDEPTTVLTPQEADQLFSSVRDMAAAGRTVIFISHKLPEVLAVADRVTILRSGRSVTTVPTAGTDADDLAGLDGRAARCLSRPSLRWATSRARQSSSWPASAPAATWGPRR